MKKLESKDLKLLYSDGIIRFYQVGPGGKKPLIFINGQMEHRIQAIETATNITKGSCFQYNGHYMYDENIHTPYIMVFDYPIIGNDKARYDTMLFADSLIRAIRVNNLTDVDIMGISAGGIVGMRASRDERVDQVRAIHPPIQSSPLANLDLIHDRYGDLTVKEKMIYTILKVVVDPRFGFQKENAMGFMRQIDSFDLDKIMICSSAINGSESVDGLSKTLCDLVYKLSNQDSDGIVCYNKDTLESVGFQVLEDEAPRSHFAVADYDYTTGIYNSLVLNRKK